MVVVEVILLDEVEEWYVDLAKTDRGASDAVTAAIDINISIPDNRYRRWLDGEYD